MGENVCKQGDEQRSNLPNIQTAHVAQQKKKEKKFKMGRGRKQTFL